MENTDYTNSESRLCYGLFRKCRRRQQPSGPSYQVQPEAKKETPEPEIEKKEKKEFSRKNVKEIVSDLWDRGREAKEYLSGKRQKYDELLATYGAERLGDLVKAREEFDKAIKSLNERYLNHEEKYEEAYRAKDMRNVEAEINLMTKIFEQYYSFSRNLEREMREFEDSLPELEEVERDIEKLGEPGVEEKQQVVDPLPTKEDLREGFDEKKEAERKEAERKKAEAEKHKENKLKSINDLRDYRHDLKTRLREVQRRGEDSKALEALNAAAHQNSPWETKRKIIIFKFKVQRGTYEIPEHEMKALNHVINKIRYITPEETSYPE